MGRKEQVKHFLNGMAIACPHLETENGGYHCKELGKYRFRCVFEECSYTKQLSEKALDDARRSQSILQLIRKAHPNFREKYENLLPVQTEKPISN